MRFGPVPINRLPKQDPERVLRMAERWQRATESHNRWAEPAKEAVDFFEGRQYSQAILAELKRKRKPHLKFNIIRPIVRLVIGYQRNNRSDVTFEPAHDARSTDETATAATALEKSAAINNMMEFLDAEVFLDGLVTGRGFFRDVVDWESNDLGELKSISLDPFSVKIDPDADSYDLNESASYLINDKMVSIDEIEASLGKKVAAMVRPYTMGQTPLAPLAGYALTDDIAPMRYFGQREDNVHDWWDNFYALMGDFVDPFRKTLRIIEVEHKVREPRNVIIDLETGDKKTLPVNWGPDKIDKVLLWCEEQGNPCIVERRMVQHIQWTTMAGDLLIHDAPSYYDRFSITGFFPYFRRGITQGMVEDLVDPQKEKNKNRNSRVEIQSKLANGGWKYHESSLDPDQERNLKRFGSSPGVNIKWKGQVSPEQIQPQSPSAHYERLEAKDDEDIRRISGVNESALGDTDISNQSGRAIEARQRQAVVSVQMYMDNFRHTKHLQGRNHLYIFQNFYTEERIYRVKGDDGKKKPLVINQRIAVPDSGVLRILNDITLGKYAVVVDDRPLNPTFEAAQFEEMMALLEKLGPALGNFLPVFADLIIGMSSMPRKQEWIDRIQSVLGSMGMPGMVPPGAAPAGALPPGAGAPAALPPGAGAPPLLAAPTAPPPGGAVGLPPAA
ncbi:MAG: hypothetical protein IT537_03225 [Hyphomicrobiales bacterium]|nr:hypothetical protein [Hyphomicrobiales bacterium]